MAWIQASLPTQFGQEGNAEALVCVIRSVVDDAVINGNRDS